MQVFWGFLVIAIIYYVINEYFWHIVAAATVITVFCFIKKSIRKAEEEEERKKNEAIARQREEDIRVRKEEERANKKREEDRHSAEMHAAQAMGTDVCWNCKTIQPKRCKCGKCIASHQCHKSYESYNECKDCCRERNIRECKKAEAGGKDVCWGCLTVEPGRCYCGNCQTCYGNAGGNECNSCSSDD